MSSDEDRQGGAPRRVIARAQVPPGPLAELKAVLYELYVEAATPTLDQVAAWIRADGDLAGAPGRDTIARIIGGPGMPAKQVDVVAVATVLARAARWDPRDAAGRVRDLWVTARLASSAPPSLPDAPAGAEDKRAGTGRVAEADLRRLGVHASITVTGAPDDVPPAYVARDTDDQLRAKIAIAAAEGGFVLLVGGSSVGKTRCAAEVVKALLPQWRLLHPAEAAEVAALAAAPVLQTVVWLDELQRYLGGENSLTGGVVRALLGSPHPVVIIATLWPDWYQLWTELPGRDGADVHAPEREVLDLADVIRIAPELTAAEQDRARAAAARDRRLAVALATAGYGLTQTLAAGPQLVARWEDARDTHPYAWAVMTAALDAARFGARDPLAPDFLRAAAPGYCSSRQRAEAPKDWFGQALAYAVVKVHGAAAALSAAGPGMGQIAGYTPADYLIQHAGRVRRSAQVPASTWDALLRYHRHDPDDLFRLADSAQNRLLYCYAVPLYRHAARAGHRAAAGQLSVWLAERGDFGALRTRADAGDTEAVYQLADLLEQGGDLDEALQVLRTQAGTDDGWGDWHLAQLLARHRDVPRLRAEADAGNTAAAVALAGLLAERGDLPSLQSFLGARQQGDTFPLVELLATRSDLDGLRALAEDGNRLATMALVRLLAERGDFAEAGELLRARAAAGDSTATALLVRLLAVTGQPEEMKQAVYLLRTQAEDGDVAVHLSELAADLMDLDGDLDGLQARAAAGDGPAARRLAALLAGQEDLDGLQALTEAGNEWAHRPLAKLLAERGDLDKLRKQANAGNLDAILSLTDLLSVRGDVDELRARADTGDWNAAGQLAALLVEQGDLDGLLARVNAGDSIAARRVAALLAKQGRDEEAERVHRFGLTPDGSIANSLPGVP